MLRCWGGGLLKFWLKTMKSIDMVLSLASAASMRGIGTVVINLPDGLLLLHCPLTMHVGYVSFVDIGINRVVLAHFCMLPWLCM